MKLNFSLKKYPSKSSNMKNKEELENEFHHAINLLITQRKKLGISLEELSKKTKISRNVLIAIENGRKQNLPEKTYLISMLRRLEIELDLEKGGLNGIQFKNITINNISNLKFNFINIDFLSTWIGSLLYLIFMFSAILALNSQQRYLLKINSISTDPITANDDGIGNKNKIISK